MDTSKCGVGLLTTYDVYLVILRQSNNHIVLSSPVIRSAVDRNSLADPFRNDLSVCDLFLALLLFASQPQRLEETPGIWEGLYVRSGDLERPCTFPRTGPHTP